jgi:hypothetical protein
MRSSVERYFRYGVSGEEMDVQVVTAPRGVTARERPAEFSGGGGGGISGGSFDFCQPQSSASMPDFGDLLIGSLMDLSVVPSAARRPADEEMRIAKEGFLRMIGGPGMLGAIHQTLTMRELCVVLESGLRQVFVDETGTTTPYEVHVGSPMAAGPTEPEEFLRLVCEELWHRRHAGAARGGDLDHPGTLTQTSDLNVTARQMRGGGVVVTRRSSTRFSSQEIGSRTLRLPFEGSKVRGFESSWVGRENPRTSEPSNPRTSEPSNRRNRRTLEPSNLRTLWGELHVHVAFGGTPLNRLRL